jgi:hypothetical protein
MATPKDGNPIWMLFILYFAPCDLMHQHHGGPVATEPKVRFRSPVGLGHGWSWWICPDTPLQDGWVGV